MRKPEYYLVITNARLTPSAKNSTGGGSGGIDLIDSYFEEWNDRVPLKGWQVWHSDKIRTLLDSNQQVRVRYSAWVTEGDVLAAIMRSFGSPDFTNVLLRAVARDLKRDRDIKRKDAGQVTQKKIFLEDIFVDLPLSAHTNKAFVKITEDYDIDSGDTIIPSSMLNEDALADSFLSKILRRASEKLDRAATPSRRKKERARDRIVLLGGPGQGKSTLAQFLAQVFRAKIGASSQDCISAEVQEASEAVLARARAEEIYISGPVRYPVHVELPKFADAIAEARRQGDQISVLTYCTRLLSASSDETISSRHLREWLAAVPWLVIFDGLDEVPPSGNRVDVVQCVNDFFDEIAQAKADVLVLVTSRPQGYGDDFSRDKWEHWELADLDGPAAMRFAGRLADTLLSDGSRRDEILRELDRATKDPATAPIMISPLQVAILFSLVETKGGVPADRWTLFFRYYELLRDREGAKEGLYAALLRQYRAQIDQIHYDLGLILHVKAESSGSADAYMQIEEFHQLVRRQLASEGHRPETVAEVSSQIAKLATDRLVMIGCKTGSRVAFDVRSLQEFMAAARIMSSPEAQIGARLKEISARSHWRHVMRICCSKVFAYPDLRHLRELVVGICSSLDEGDWAAPDRIIRAGARLASDLLEDGIAITIPDYRRALARRALHLLDLGPGMSTSLTEFVDADTVEVFEQAIGAKLSLPFGPLGFPAWELLTSIMRRKATPPWAMKLCSQHWPTNPEDVLRLAQIVEGALSVAALTPQFRTAQAAAGFWPTIRALSVHAHSYPEQEFDSLSLIPWRALSPMSVKAAEVNLKQNGKSGAIIRFLPLTHTFTASEAFSHHVCSGFEIIEAREKFLERPSKDSLAQVLERAAEFDSLSDAKYLTNPWPLEAALADCNSTDDLRSKAAEIRAGGFGDLQGWKAAEDRWRRVGVVDADVHTILHGSFVRPDIAEIGLPLFQSVTPP